MEIYTRTRGVLFRTMYVAVCYLFVGACSVAQVKDAGRQIGESALEQAFIFAVGGMDALQECRDDEDLEWLRESNPYRNAFTRETYLEAWEREEFEHLYDKLRAKE